MLPATSKATCIRNVASPKVITKPKFAVGLLLAFDGYPLMIGEFAPVVSGVFKSVIIVSKSFVNLPLNVPMSLSNSLTAATRLDFAVVVREDNVPTLVLSVLTFVLSVLTSASTLLAGTSKVAFMFFLLSYVSGFSQIIPATGFDGSVDE